MNKSEVFTNMDLWCSTNQRPHDEKVFATAVSGDRAEVSSRLVPFQVEAGHGDAATKLELRELAPKRRTCEVLE